MRKDLFNFVPSFYGSVNFVVFTLWSIISPSEWRRTTKTTDKFGRVESSYGSCTSDYEDFFRILLALPNISIILLAAFQAYKARDITTELSESRYIMLSLASVLFILVLAIPVSIIAASSNPRAIFFSQYILTFMIGMTIILFIFGPKIVRFYEKKPKNGLRSSTVPNRFLRKSRQFSIQMNKMPNHPTPDKTTIDSEDNTDNIGLRSSLGQEGMRIVHVRQTESGWKKEKSALEAKIKDLELRLFIQEDKKRDAHLVDEDEMSGAFDCDLRSSGNQNVLKS